jgi:preprotein translocase subunit SecF
MYELVPKTFWYDFVARRRFWAIVSFVLSGLGLLVFIVIGPNWSIDFTGGTEVDFHFDKPTTIAEVRHVLEKIDISEEAVQQLGGDNDNRFEVRLQGASSAAPEEIAAVKSALSAAKGADWVTDFKTDAQVGTRAAVTYSGAPVTVDKIQDMVKQLPGVSITGSPQENTFYVRMPGIAERIKDALSQDLPDHGLNVERADSVGPKVGGSLREAGIKAVLVSWLLHLLYIAVRFDFTFAPGAVICLMHDVAITVGILVVARTEFGLSTLSALLTLSGYSLNDTVVVYDRIRENMDRYRRKNFGDLINESINQTLSRTIIVSGATALAMIPFLFWGGAVLRQFASVMLIGIVIGTYSSIYVAAPLTMILRENQDAIRRLVGLGPRAAPKGTDTVGTKGK